MLEAQRDDVRRSLSTLFDPGDVFELRAFNVQRKASWRPTTEYGFFNDFETAADAAVEASVFGATGVFVTLNPCNTALLARSANHFSRAEKGNSAKDKDITRRHWLPVDIDPTRPAGISSTDVEKEAARAVMKGVVKWLQRLGWADPIIGDSGNGYHLLYRIDWPTDDKDIVSKCLEALSLWSDTDMVKIDTVVHNPSRIWKLYGTTVRKGDNIEERPHRVARLLHIPPEGCKPLSKAAVKRLLATVPKVPAGNASRAQKNRREALDLWLSQRDWEIGEGVAWKNKGRKWILKVCPWNDEHTDESAFVIQFNDTGKVVAGCHHEGCKGKNWDDLVEEHGDPWQRKRRDNTDNANATPQRGWALGQQLPLTDMGNAHRFRRLHEGTSCFVGDQGVWRVYNGIRWERDHVYAVETKAMATVRSIHSEALVLGDPDEAEKTLKWYHRSQAAARVGAMITLARSACAQVICAFDQDDLMFNTRSGTLVLDEKGAGIVERRHDRSDLITHVADVQYDAAETCPTWDRFCLEFMDGDPEMVDYIQAIAGSCLTGLTNAQELYFFVGVGANGKSTFLTTLQKILGTYARQAAPDLLTTAHGTNAGHPTSVADLLGARLVVAAEVERGSKINEVRVKQLTGEDVQKGRFMRQDWFEFKPTHKIFVAANHKPMISGSDEGIWRRIRLIECSRYFSEEERDVNLQAKLLAERNGILNWLIEGALKFLAGDVSVPTKVLASTREYRTDNDILGEFIQTFCALGVREEILAKRLYDFYGSFCEESGDRPVKRRTFNAILDERGFGSRRDGRGLFRTGISIRPLTSPVPTENATWGDA